MSPTEPALDDTRRLEGEAALEPTARLSMVFWEMLNELALDSFRIVTTLLFTLALGRLAGNDSEEFIDIVEGDVDLDKGRLGSEDELTLL
ncbi:hypothetical protein SERLA73DRAFT_128877 [Serpula lacrymans var. lacrymans S7.3]|uniref:Uncharacterized protein n=2 Tax=Serpula lacrymans var. lacrymans TaxID=341189 RepID=F8PI82_SERL3|nr:uncharacterized protein SERLADRAFT_376110 [Serpula lacrymans var. lacrymans S7.9]EGO05125.1 hypothetical protein SERLA73DRAFT_128877 [Serpula lacrymans var. lacrymans S7.3]EGO30880.1 hypothetical protein SERLADRAFT_376110 [Serpula lacrymans var. lacrymans S7.9]